MKTDVLEKEGKKVVLQGNEAIVRGALEAGVGFATAYPGTPSTEIPVTFSNIAQKLGIYFEYSTNEKIAVEAAAGAAWCGVRSMTSMKHFGLNVASDSVLPIAYTGVRAGFVIMVADDPGGWSSVQSEQDTRFYARMAKIPMLEPSNPQECLDFTKIAFEISEKFEIPVFLRTTTNVSHSIGSVVLGELKEIRNKGEFRKNPDKYNLIKPRLQELHKLLMVKIKDIEEKYGNKVNTLLPGEGRIGLIVSGVAFDYCREAMKKSCLNLPVAKIGMSYPLSTNFLSDFIRDKEKVLVLEELEPVVEDFVRQVAKDVNPKLVVHGKDLLPRYGEYNAELVISALDLMLDTAIGRGFQKHAADVENIRQDLLPRTPVLCSGCPHRSTFFAIKKVFGNKTIYAGDIGCCILGVFPPYEMQNFCISMGAGVGLAHGMSQVSSQDIVAVIGDSTFFHSGMPAIANFSANSDKSPIIVILDNGTTAMTGHQPHPGAAMNSSAKTIKIEDMIHAFGAEVKVVNSFNVAELVQALGELKSAKGLRILVSRGECRLLTKRKLKKEGLNMIKFRIDQEKCRKCGACVELFACPAISKTKKDNDAVYGINPDSCLGCSVCSQICPHKAIIPVKNGGKDEV